MTIVPFIFCYSCLYNLIVIAVVVTNNHVKIFRTVISDTNVITLRPSATLENILGKLSDVVYFPNIIPLHWGDDVDNFCDDFHFCSLLCDKGYLMHCVDPSSILKDTAAIPNVIDWVSKNSKNGYFSIVAHELTVPRLLNWLAEVTIFLLVHLFIIIHCFK